MTLLTREFSFREKVSLPFRSIILLVLLYVRFVYIPVQDAQRELNSQKEQLKIECQNLENKIYQYQLMEADMKEASQRTDLREMASYNNRKAELAFLNDVLAGTSSYSIVMDDLARNDTLVRRGMNMSFVVSDYNQAKAVLNELAGYEYRCLITEVTVYSENNDISNGMIAVRLHMIFYETLTGGELDGELPADGSVEEEIIPE